MIDDPGDIRAVKPSPVAVDMLRRRAKGTDVDGVYCRMYVALWAGKGVRLSVSDLEALFGDDAIITAVEMIVEEEP